MVSRKYGKMDKKTFRKGDYSNGYREIWIDDIDVIMVSCDSVDFVFDTLEENEELKEENKELKSLCKVLINEIEKKSIAFVITDDVRRLLE